MENGSIPCCQEPGRLGSDPSSAVLAVKAGAGYLTVLCLGFFIWRMILKVVALGIPCSMAGTLSSQCMGPIFHGKLEFCKIYICYHELDRFPIPNEISDEIMMVILMNVITF